MEKYGVSRSTNEDKTTENLLRWFGHVYRNSIDATVRRIDCLEVTDLGGEKNIRKLV